MVENVITNKVQIEGYENIKQLKDAIALLRKEMVELNEDSEAHKKKAEELATAEYNLKQAMSANRKDTSALAGSYNELQNQMTALKKVWRETNDEATRNQLGQQIAELDTKLKSMDASVGVFTRNVGNYKSALKGLKEELLQMEPGSEGYISKMQEAADMTHKLAEQQEMLRYSTSDVGDQISNITQIGAKMASGFAAINAAVGLFGSKNEDLNKVLVKVQQTMALMQGLQGLDGLLKRTKGLSTALGLTKATIIEDTVATEANNLAKEKNVALTEADTIASTANATATKGQAVATNVATKAQKGLNAAMKANPIGFVITAVMALVSVIVLFKDQLMSLFNIADARRKKEEKAMRDAAADRAKDLDNYIKDNKAKYGSDWEYTEKAIKANRDLLNAKIESYEKDTEEYKQALRDKDEYERLLREHNAAQQRKVEEERLQAIDDWNNKLKELGDNWEDQVFSLVATDKEAMYQTQKGQIDAWNDFIKNSLPKQKGINLLIPEKGEFGSQLTQLLNIFKSDFQKPLLDYVEDEEGRVMIAITQKNIDTIKEARTRVEEAITKDLLTSLYKTELDWISREETTYKRVTDNIEANLTRLHQIESYDLYDLQAEEEDALNDRLAQYDMYIDELGLYIEDVKSIYGEDSEIFKTHAKDIVELQMYYNNEKVKATNESNKRLSSLNRKWAEDELSDSKKDMEIKIKEAQQDYELYASTLDTMWIKNGNLTKAQNEMFDNVFEIQKVAYEEMIENLNYYLEEEYLTADDELKIRTQLANAEMELADLELEHEIEVNNRRREAMQTTVNAIKDSAQATGDLLGKWADGYKMVIDAQVATGKMSEKEAEKAFETVKTAQVAQAIMNTLSAAIGAYQSMASIPYVGPILGAAAATAALGYGYAQVKQIQATTYGSSSTSTGNVPTNATTAIRDYEPTMTRNMTGAQETENLINAMEKRPLYVSVTDIDKAQTQVTQKNRETTF